MPADAVSRERHEPLGFHAHGAKATAVDTTSSNSRDNCNSGWASTAKGSRQPSGNRGLSPAPNRSSVSGTRGYEEQAQMPCTSSIMSCVGRGKCPQPAEHSQRSLLFNSFSLLRHSRDQGCLCRLARVRRCETHIADGVPSSWQSASRNAWSSTTNDGAAIVATGAASRRKQRRWLAAACRDYRQEIESLTSDMLQCLKLRA